MFIWQARRKSQAKKDRLKFLLQCLEGAQNQLATELPFFFRG
jgi:hypothetical protein